ncbi:MAG TPA: penicillin-binding transpeptidase domain-containing protein, partial [Hyphomicrobiales bacterium]|nr:penicillin-binding transpeptidase domain-containing protein [Hyphomicrobiales bacterium]
VTLPEAAVLAGLLKAPSRYAPTRNPDLAANRAELVIGRMVEVGFISPSEGIAAISHPAELVHPDALGAIDYAADWIADLVPGFIGQPASDVIVETTIDPALQAAAERALAGVLDEEGKARGAGQGALVAVDPTGAVKAMVGGRSYAQSQFNRATRAFRQPGSAFKPFVYLAALESGLTPETVRLDGPVTFANWSPKNYDGKYRGRVTLRQGLSNSLNTVAARLANEVGVERIVATARRLGITAPLGRDLSIALGTSEVTLLQLTGAYVPFSNGGFGVVPHVIERVRTVDGKLLYQRTGSGPGRVIRSADVGAMNSMLQTTLRSGTAKRGAFGEWPAAGKTGTSQSWRDAWFIGYTARLAAGVWIGNDDATAMNRVTGGGLPAKVWHRFMAEAHGGLKPVPLPGDYWRDPDRGAPVAAASRFDEDPARLVTPPAPRREDRTGFFDGGFLRRIFGG